MSKIRIEGRTRIWVLCIVGLLQGLLILQLWLGSTPEVKQSYLLKVGKSYILAVEDSSAEKQYRLISFSSLKQAVDHAENTLGLERAHNVYFTDLLERLILANHKSSFVLQWKFLLVPYIHQLTFQDQAEAAYFTDSIKRGFYSTSPFGHSIYFFPRKAQAIR